MTNLKRIQAKARELARSGKFHGWRPIAFELRFRGRPRRSARVASRRSHSRWAGTAVPNCSRSQERGRL